jgi:hypothetical protein
MGNKSAKDIKALIEADKVFIAKLAAIGIKLDDVIDSVQAEKKIDFNALYDKLTTGGIFIEQPPTPICGGHSHWDGTKCVCDVGYHDVNGECVLDAPHPPPPPPVEGNILYDSNRDGGWNNGIARLVKKSEGNIGPKGKGVFTAASGNPELEILGDGTAILRTTGADNFGRIYICCINYDSTLQLSFQLSKNVEDLSLKVRSRHQEGGACENRQGGMGFAMHHSEYDSKREVCHNIQDSLDKGKLSKTIQDGVWITVKLTCKDEGAKAIRMIGEIDYGDGKFVKEMDHLDTAAPAYFFDKALNAQNSYFWIRLNSTANASGPNELKLKDVTVTAL